MIFDKKKMDLLKNKIEAIKQKEEQRGAFSLFHSKIVEDFINKATNYKGMKYAFDLIDSYTGKYNLPYNFGISLEDFINRDDLVVCIHRTNMGLDADKPGIPKSDVLESIMKDGLRNFGHSNATGGTAISDKLPDLTLTTTSINNLGGYINLITNYHENDTTVIMGFPTTLVNKSGNIIDGKGQEIYNTDSGTPTIKPEYIMGALLKKNNGFDEFYLKDEILKAQETMVM